MTDLIYKESSQLSQDAIIEMFEIDLQSLGLGIFRFSPTHSSGVVTFEGHEYPPAPIQSDGFQWDGSGPLPRPNLTIAAKDLYFLNIVVDMDDLVGQPVKRIKTFRKYLDDGTHPGTGAKFSDENYVIERKASQSRHMLKFELSTKLDQQGTQIPIHAFKSTGCGLREDLSMWKLPVRMQEVDSSRLMGTPLQTLKKMLAAREFQIVRPDLVRTQFCQG